MGVCGGNVVMKGVGGRTVVLGGVGIYGRKRKGEVRFVGGMVMGGLVGLIGVRIFNWMWGVR